MAFCKPVRLKIKSILKDFDEYVEEHVQTALAITRAVEKLLKSPVTDVITAIIPSHIDDAIRDRLLTILPYAIDTLVILKNCKDAETLDAKASCFLEELKKVNPELKNAILHKLASIIARELDDSKLAQSVYDLFVQAQYSLDKK